MHDLIKFIKKNPGPWLVGFTTNYDGDEPGGYFADSFECLCDGYQISENEDCIAFHRGKEGEEVGRIVLPLASLTDSMTGEDMIAFVSTNLRVDIESFDPNVLVYVRCFS
jgi:hypothetical protein